MTRLPWDCARCEGQHCVKRETCVRHEQLSNMGPRTPIFPTCVVDELGGFPTFPCYWPIEKEPT